jgi:hypothetical protein
MINWLWNNKEWIFSGIGVAVLFSLISWFFRKRTENSERRNLKVNLAFGFLASGPRLSDQMILLTVANPGERAIQITAVRIPVGKNALYFLNLDGERRLPCLVDPGTNLKFWVELTEIERALKSRGYRGKIKIRAVVADALGAEHKSNPVRVSL